LKRHEFEGLTVERNRSDFPALLAQSISQAGYNTVFEALAAQRRLVLVPYSEPGEAEQCRRAALMEGHGLASVIALAELNASRLACVVAAALELPAPANIAIDFRVAAHCADIIRELSEKIHSTGAC